MLNIERFAAPMRYAAPVRKMGAAIGDDSDRERAGAGWHAVQVVRRAPKRRPSLGASVVPTARGPRSAHEPIRPALAGWPRVCAGRPGAAHLRAAFGRGLGAILLVAAVAGCEGLHPYRTHEPQAGLTCNPRPGPGYYVDRPCWEQIHEHSEHYDLFFAEFTDQGLQYPIEKWGAAGYQIEYTMRGLNQIALDRDYDGISLVVYVHGWQHNAKHDDRDVRGFRALLQSAAAIERVRGTNHRVVGVYVGWRGRSIDAGPVLSNLSFWTRKATALRVAQGSTRELFGRLGSFKCAQNRAPDRERGHTGFDACTEPAGDGARPKVRMLMIGHSFGGLILYNAVSEALIRSLTYDRDTPNTSRGGTGGGYTPNTGYADMVVLLNPAIEASRYTPLHRVATKSYRHYQAPLLVSVTSTTDGATGTAFPIGRFANTLFENEASAEEGKAINRTIGHMPEYITHELFKIKDVPEQCKRWKPPPKTETIDEYELRIKHNLEIEEKSGSKFSEDSYSLSDGWRRVFCSSGGGIMLKHVEYEPNRYRPAKSVIWNVRAHPSVMDGHNHIGLDNEELTEFLRQLYQDTLPAPPTPKAMTAPAGAGAVGPVSARR